MTVRYHITLYLLFLTLCTLFISPVPSHGQDAILTETATTSPEVQITSDTTSPNESPKLPIVLRNVSFNITGITMSFVLRQKLETDGALDGKVFNTLEDFTKFLAEKRQVLLNNRVLAKVETSYELFETDKGSEADIVFSVTDSWNIFAVPEPKYDSNAGLTIGIKARDYNFLGSVNPLVLDIKYNYDNKERHSFSSYLNFKFPFQLLDLEWTTGLAQTFAYTINKKFKSVTELSLSLLLPGFNFPAMAIIYQRFHYNDNDDENLTPILDTYFLGSELDFSFSIPINLSLPSVGNLVLKIDLGLAKNWWPYTPLYYYNRDGLHLFTQANLSAGSLNWNGNMKRGMIFSVSNRQEINLIQNNFTWKLDASYSYAEHWLDKLVGFSLRVLAFDYPMGKTISQGHLLRGIIDERLYAAWGTAVNINVPIRLFFADFTKLIGVDWLNFEMQLQPFVDFGLIAPNFSAKIDTSMIWATGGLELLFFPAAIRSVIVRASIGFDIKSIIQNKSFGPTSDGYRPFELYIGTGLIF